MPASLTSLVSGSSSVQTTTVTFPAQPVGTILVVSYTGDDYATSFTSGWTRVQDVAGGSFHGAAVWWKASTGAETTFSYSISGAYRTAYKAVAITGLDTTSPVGASAKSNQNASSATYTSPTLVPPTGEHFILQAFGAGSSGALLTNPAYSSPYTSQGSGLSTSVPGLSTSHGTNTVTGNGSTAVATATATWSGATPESRSCISVAFKVAAAASPKPKVMVSGVETAASWSVMVNGVETPVKSWSVMQAGVEKPLV